MRVRCPADEARVICSFAYNLIRERSENVLLSKAGTVVDSRKVANIHAETRDEYKPGTPNKGKPVGDSEERCVVPDLLIPQDTEAYLDQNSYENTDEVEV